MSAANTVGGFAGNLSGKPDVFVPQEVCEALGIEPGDSVKFQIHEDRVVMTTGEIKRDPTDGFPIGGDFDDSVEIVE